jgi:hypothetical protein
MSGVNHASPAPHPPDTPSRAVLLTASAPCPPMRRRLPFLVATPVSAHRCSSKVPVQKTHVLLM